MAEAAEQIYPFNDADSKSEKKPVNSRLTQFLQCLLENNIKFKIPRSEIRDIKAAIYNMVSEVVCLVSSRVPWLQSSRLVEVGSMAEGTKIVKPDEFDYIVVLEQNGVEVNRVCEGRSGYAHVKVTDRERRHLWCKWLKNDYMCGKIGLDFMPLKVLKQFVPQRYFNTLSDAYRHEFAIVLMENGEGIKQRTKTGMMRIDTSNVVECHGPAFMPKFKWSSFRPGGDLIISVDITVAIETALTPDIITPDDVHDMHFFTKVQDHGTFMLVPCKQTSCVEEMCFRLTFTEVEVALVTELSQHHKHCYMLIKYLFGGQGGYQFFPSYAWKTILLKHSRRCKENENLANCVQAMISACLHYLFNRNDAKETLDPRGLLRFVMAGKNCILHIPSIFLKEHNILDTKEYLTTCEQFLAQTELMLRSLNRIEHSDVDPADLLGELHVANSGIIGTIAYIMSWVSKIRSGSFTLDLCMEYYQKFLSNNTEAMYE